jgi:ABC-type tungstate transport system permease subunit
MKQGTARVLPDWMEVESQRQKVINSVVEAADRAICEAADGDLDLLLVYTTTIAQRFLEKVQIMANSELMRKELMARATS